ncbi:Hypothetical_protein [Hexamita inflata]|uniref:Hypothetical_protein n=1 Tax=Hexamita inflata TaxID=28002 RepID=A0AA86PUP5_9EUKA|nr:Hypothetical protein HINF_LOCUS33903 [Hexamita inflata]CAI9946261.1 Hypothetical protein HINF_LOCUS33906 [Hexamita inflata]CAI9946263.1 Hypothetical protein HINF_LOCUS33908 [Hexamita inflata]
MVFDASGQYLSTIMQKSLNIMNLSLSQIEFRFNCQHASGLVYTVSNGTQIDVQDVSISGYSFNENNDNGYLASQLSNQTEMIIQHVTVCTNLPNYIGEQYAALLQLTQQPKVSCLNICSQLFLPAYGLCVLQLLYGQLNEANQTLSCLNPFIFNDKQCVCSHGYLLNGQQCIDIVSQLTNIEIYLIGNITNMDQQYFGILTNINSSIQQYVAETQQQLVQVNLQIQFVNQSITTNNQQTVQSLSNIQSNILQLRNEAMINNSIQNADIVSLYATQDNIKAEIAIIRNTLSNLNSSGSSNITADREYTCSTQGLAYSNGKCTCPAKGQIFYNGGCKCTAFYYNQNYLTGFCTKLQLCCQYGGSNNYYCTDNQWYDANDCGFLT